MNTKQLSDWQQLVRQCKTQCARQTYNSINVASTVRSEAIVAAGTLVELVTPELAELLERLAASARVLASRCPIAERGLASLWRGDAETGLARAARIREALEVTDA